MFGPGRFALAYGQSSRPVSSSFFRAQSRRIGPAEDPADGLPIPFPQRITRAFGILVEEAAELWRLFLGGALPLDGHTAQNLGVADQLRKIDISVPVDR
ncbi:hypothetical protein GCM10010112_32690 [Actinoplanes lobatus]|uniref:Uncharacterized protein n=1 Tax=Actinoplanes lobatus TaxID=113568 RepID=A0A7W7MG28_9ACTN|nr:hypothetical protein [Actinoplanes lobatus]MBB4748982.1 hypothetical protein [Actinoplanes lobatus]GGN68389.1 hypothetical protein GCM10010112_32690 [Actinoplanes lobatus]GIE37110.1 hypothetical protein Alo02nite_00080 [Actinoplanes lobatus]